MTDALQDPSTSTAISEDVAQTGRQRPHRVWIVAVSVFLVAGGSALVVGIWHYHVEPLPHVAKDILPLVQYEGSRTVLKMPGGTLVGKVGSYTDELTAYLRFDYLKGIQSISDCRLFIVTDEMDSGPEYNLYLELPNDILTAEQSLSGLVIEGHIGGFALESRPVSDIQKWDEETNLFDAAYQRPVRDRLLRLPRKALTSAVASFILFKIRTDRRVRKRLEPAAAKELSIEDARNFAADMIAISEFYDIPLDMLLGIGAMENNYLDIRGDLKHAIWKKHAQKGDIILRRREGRVLVSNYSVGPWQITRETLRYAHSLYLRDKRDYEKLPPRLRPPRQLDLNHINSDVLTTYAGLLLRNLLDYFHGDVQKAEGAYNGGPKDPNLSYSSGVSTVASYARRVVGLAAGRKGNAISQTPMVVTGK